jgi:uncharacterized spore protein YtfJ
MAERDRNPAQAVIGRISDLQEKAGIKMVFGEPIAVEGRTIIPVAKIRYGFGLGMGHGSRPGQEASGEGAGGGGGMTARPVALVEITADGVKVKPIPDVTRLAMMGLALVAWNVFWVTMTVRALARRRGA